MNNQSDYIIPKHLMKPESIPSTSTKDAPKEERANPKGPGGMDIWNMEVLHCQRNYFFVVYRWVKPLVSAEREFLFLCCFRASFPLPKCIFSVSQKHLTDVL